MRRNFFYIMNNKFALIIYLTFLYFRVLFMVCDAIETYFFQSFTIIIIFFFFD